MFHFSIRFENRFVSSPKFFIKLPISSFVFHFQVFCSSFKFFVTFSLNSAPFLFVSISKKFLVLCSCCPPDLLQIYLISTLQYKAQSQNLIKFIIQIDIRPTKKIDFCTLISNRFVLYIFLSTSSFTLWFRSNLIVTLNTPISSYQRKNLILKIKIC